MARTDELQLTFEDLSVSLQSQRRGHVHLLLHWYDVLGGRVGRVVCRVFCPLQKSVEALSFTNSSTALVGRVSVN